MAQDVGRGHDVLVVLEGFALALEDHAGDRALGRFTAHAQHLVDDLPGLEVPLEAHAAGFAERALEGAARLRGHANGESRQLERNAHSLEDAAVARAKEVLHEGIDGAATSIRDLEPIKPPRRHEGPGFGLLQSGDLVEIVPVIVSQTRHHPAGLRHGEADIGKPFDESLRSQAAQMGGIGRRGPFVHGSTIAAANWLSGGAGARGTLWLALAKGGRPNPGEGTRLAGERLARLEPGGGAKPREGPAMEKKDNACSNQEQMNACARADTGGQTCHP